MNKIAKLLVAVEQRLFVRDDLRNLESENEISGRLPVPAFHCRKRWRRVERGIDFDRVKFCGVVREIFGGFHALGVKRAVPAVSCERGGADAEVRHR